MSSILMKNKKTSEWRKTEKSLKYTQMFVSENSLFCNELGLLLKYLDFLSCVDGLCEERLSRLTPKTTSASGLAAGPCGRLVGCSHHGHWETWQEKQMCGELVAFLETELADEKKRTKSQKKTQEEESWGSPKGAGWRCSWWLFPSCSDTGAQSLWLGTQSRSLLHCTLELGAWLARLMIFKIHIWVCFCSGNLPKLRKKFSSGSDVNSFEALVAVAVVFQQWPTSQRKPVHF